MDSSVTSSGANVTPVTTFLITDIEGSTHLWEAHPHEMRRALEHHDATCRDVVQAHRGNIIKGTGDGILAAFLDPLDAILAALDLQRQLKDAAVIPTAPLRIRCGLHAGVVEHRDNDVFGTAVNAAQRIMSCAHGGQVLVSQVVAGLVRGRLPQPIAFHDLGEVRLRDMIEPERVFQL
ncbi:MAG: adenylate/guanylate cyclase domain-containing protein, partial [Pseudomonadota bacterium]|nr:adenylate/guanylate cyclase domain-containing protein [Pseudomonadota bacterium]